MRHYHNSQLLQTNCYIFMHDISQITENCHHTQRSIMTNHVFIVDIMFTELFRFCGFPALHLWHEFVSCWGVVGTMLGHGRHNVGSWLVQCWVLVGAMLGDG